MKICNGDNEYIPLNQKTIKTGQSFGPIVYSIHESSHIHHIEYIQRDINSFADITDKYLYPFEIYSLPRTLSISGGYKKLNEIISISGERILLQPCKPNCLMSGYVYVDKILSKNGLLYGIFSSKTLNEKGEYLLESKDILILVNGSDKKTLKNQIQKSVINKTYIQLNIDYQDIGSIMLSYRHSWDELFWKNNIHTDIYAQSLGYEKGLIEAPCLVDIILSNKSVSPLIKKPSKVSWNYFGPLYHGTLVKFLMNIKDEIITVLIINSEDDSQLMKLKIEKYEK